PIYWMSSGGGVITPGHIYAMLVMCGLQDEVNPIEGAGRIRMPDAGLVWWGVRTLSQSQALTLDLDPMGRSMAKLDAAIWWPEYGNSGAGGFPSAQEQTWFTLQGDGPNGVSKRSVTACTVFQKLHLDGTASTGHWKIKLTGIHVPTDDQEVYFAAWLRP